MTKCNFSYKHYRETLTKYMNAGYKFVTLPEYRSFKNKTKLILIRHDVDKSVKKSLDLARIENALGIKSTFLFRLHSNYYNPFSYMSYTRIKNLVKMGHEVGLHSEYIDIARISIEDPLNMFEREIRVFADIFGFECRCYSLHRTTGSTAIEEQRKDAQYISEKYNLIGSYDDEIFTNIKYISDSSGFWREGCFCRHIDKQSAIQILIHPEWWYENNIELEEPLV